MKRILALLFFCATSQFAHGHHFSNILPLHGLLEPNLLGMTASLLSVIGSAYSDSRDVQLKTQSSVSSSNTSEDSVKLLLRDSFASSFAGPEGGESFAQSIASSGSDDEDGDGFAQSSAFSGYEGGESFARSNSFNGNGRGDSFARSVASSDGGTGDSFAQSEASGGVANAYAASSSSVGRKPPCRKPDESDPRPKTKEFTMINETEYRCYRLGQPANNLNFKVKTAFSAYVALLGDDQFHGPTYEVFLGGWGNTKSAIKDKFEIQHYATEVETPEILSDEEFRGFWIRWDDDIIKVGKEDLTLPFMAHSVPGLYEVEYLCFFAGSGSANWIIEGVSNTNYGPQ